jgi:hypothetical protein
MSLHLCHRRNGLGKLDDVRFGSLADIGAPPADVRFALDSGHPLAPRPPSQPPTLKEPILTSPQYQRQFSRGYGL